MIRFVRCTLVQVLRGDEILLGMKKRGLGVGKWNGFGGKLNPGETLKQCAARELQEECGLHVAEHDLQQIAILMFNFLDQNFLLEVNVFKTEKFTGIPAESEEMNPKWFLRENIPYDKMWADDIYWYPKMFKNEMFYGFLEFQDQDKMVSKNFQAIENAKQMETLNYSTLQKFSVGLDQISTRAVGMKVV